VIDQGPEWGLGVWSGLGIAWWVVAWRLVAGEAPPSAVLPISAAGPRPSLSIFKPLPALGPAGLGAKAAGIESFLAQLDDRSELLLGVHAADRETVAPFLDRMRRDYPAAPLRVIFRSEPDEVANPKVAWNRLLAPHAGGELWLWSDADIVAPARFLDAARAEWAAADAKMLTFPYAVRKRSGGPALFDALFVNVEFYPGVLLLRQFGPVDFGLGAGMLFRRDDFLREVDWHELGRALADDYVLGRKLGPVRLSRTTIATAAEVDSWPEALRHYLRWSKTVWWNQPAGAAARVVVLPVFGWLIQVVFHPTQAASWAGLAVMMQLDVLFAALICRRLDYCWGLRDFLATEAWSLWRIGVWVACWFPWPVRWGGGFWRGPRSPEAPK
jgi:hypothetical protein